MVVVDSLVLASAVVGALLLVQGFCRGAGGTFGYDSDVLDEEVVCVVGGGGVEFSECSDVPFSVWCAFFAEGCGASIRGDFAGGPSMEPTER